MPNVLIIDDEKTICDVLSDMAKHMGFDATSVLALKDGVKEASTGIFDVCDVKLNRQGGLTMPNILVVDDQPCVRKLLSEELLSEGYQVQSTGDGESVGEHLRTSRPDLVLLDLYLDGPEGWEVLRDIKRQDPHLPVVIFTAYDSFVDDPRLSQADGYVIKSVDLDQLKQKIADVLNRKMGRERKAQRIRFAFTGKNAT